VSPYGIGIGAHIIYTVPGKKNNGNHLSSNNVHQNILNVPGDKNAILNGIGGCIHGLPQPILNHPHNPSNAF